MEIWVRGRRFSEIKNDVDVVMVHSSLRHFSFMLPNNFFNHC